MLLFAVISLTITNGWILQHRAPHGLILSPGQIEDDETFELPLDQPDGYNQIDDSALPLTDHPDTRTEWSEYANDIGIAVEMRGVLWFPPNSFQRVMIAPHMVDPPETVAATDV
eukprot:25360-Rhodomonas_salina.1